MQKGVLQFLVIVISLFENQQIGIFILLIILENSLLKRLILFTHHSDLLKTLYPFLNTQVS